jgi:hypothetical protein
MTPPSTASTTDAAQSLTAEPSYYVHVTVTVRIPDSADAPISLREAMARTVDAIFKLKALPDGSSFYGDMLAEIRTPKEWDARRKRSDSRRRRSDP